MTMATAVIKGIAVAIATISLAVLATIGSTVNGVAAASTIGFTEQPNAAAAAISIKPDYGITNVTAQIGTNAYLPCKVKIVFNKSVSWVRVRDDHILTVDRITFIADERFHAFHATENSGGAHPAASSSTLLNQHRQLTPTTHTHPHTGGSSNSASSANSAPWTLQIKYVQARDAGIYECQISAEPKISAQVYLHVVVPKTEPIGDTVRYVKEGSRVALHCVISGAIDPPLYVIWYHGQQQIFSENARHWKTEISHQEHQQQQQQQHVNNALMRADVSDAMQTSIGQQLSETMHRKTVGSLIIPAIKKKDSGNYTCHPSNSPTVTIVLHVINGEYSASAITSSSSSGCGYQQKSFNRFLNILCVGITLIILLITT